MSLISQIYILEIKFHFWKQENITETQWVWRVMLSYNPVFYQKMLSRKYQEWLNNFFKLDLILLLYFDPRPGPKMLFQGDTPEGSDTFQWPVIERDRVSRLRLMIWDKVKIPLCHYSDAPEESNLWTAWQLFPLDEN